MSFSNDLEKKYRGGVFFVSANNLQKMRKEGGRTRRRENNERLQEKGRWWKTGGE